MKFDLKPIGATYRTEAPGLIGSGSTGLRGARDCQVSVYVTRSLRLEVHHQRRVAAPGNGDGQLVLLVDRERGVAHR